MAKKSKEQEEVTDQEAEKRATEALRRALTTPYKPQRTLVGKREGNRGSRKKASTPNDS